VDDTRHSARTRLGVEPLEDRLAPAIVAVNGGGNTPNGTYAVGGLAVVSFLSNPNEAPATNPSNDK
jgi:hypothetical protein